MTIAAGFVSDEGILISADTEYTSGTITQDLKVFPVTLQCCELLFSGCGDRALIGTWKDIICDGISAKKDAHVSMTPDERMEDIKRIIRHETISLSGQLSQNPDALNQTELLIGVRVRDNSDCVVRLFHAANATVETIQTYVCIGAGGDIGNYLCGILYDVRKTLDSLRLVALYVVHEAKKNAPFCGGSTTSYTLRSVAPETPEITTILDDTCMVDVMHLAMHLAVASHDADTSPERLERDITAFASRLKQIRASVGQPFPPEIQEWIKQQRKT
ncbi:MAG: hypothetical protein ACRD2B_16320 [Terriglobia bacterium]